MFLSMELKTAVEVTHSLNALKTKSADVWSTRRGIVGSGDTIVFFVKCPVIPTRLGSVNAAVSRFCARSQGALSLSLPVSWSKPSTRHVTVSRTCVSEAAPAHDSLQRVIYTWSVKPTSLRQSGGKGSLQQWARNVPVLRPRSAATSASIVQLAHVCCGQCQTALSFRHERLEASRLQV